MAAKTQCPHCKQKFPNALSRHMATCMGNPEIRNRLIEVVLSHSVDGIAPGYTEYCVLAVSYGLPSIKKVLAVYGDYQDFAESIGLQTVRSAKTPVQANREWREISKKGAPRLQTADSEHARSFAQPFPLSAIDRGIRTWFDCVTHTQVTAHVLELR